MRARNKRPSVITHRSLPTFVATLRGRQRSARRFAPCFSQAAQTHQTVQLASHIGSFKASTSVLVADGNKPEAPLAALHTAVKGMVSQVSADEAASDADQKNTATGEDKLPHSTDPLLTIAAQAGWMLSAGQDIQVVAGETITWGAGRDICWAVGGSQRIQTGQAIGVLAGAVGGNSAPGDKAAGKGITLIAGKGDIEIQAQADTLQVAAKQDLSVQSKSAHIDWAAAKRIVLSTAGGASITLEGGNITVECPGTGQRITATLAENPTLTPLESSGCAPDAG